jgi:hypothetical protein
LSGYVNVMSSEQEKVALSMAGWKINFTIQVIENKN